MEAVTQIFFDTQGQFPFGKSTGSAQTGGALFEDVVREKCSLTGEEKDGFSSAIGSLAEEVEERIDSSEELSLSEKEEMKEKIEEELDELLTSGNEEKGLAFLQAVLQSFETGFSQEQIEEIAASFSVALKEDAVSFTESISGEAEPLPPAENPGEEGGAVSQALPENSMLPEDGSGRIEEDAAGAVRTTEKGVSSGKQAGEVFPGQGISVSEKIEEAPAAAATDTQSFPETVEQAETAAGRRGSGAEVKAGGANPLAEQVSLAGIAEGAVSEDLLAAEMPGSEGTVQEKIDLLQTIRDMTEKAEFTQSGKNWQAEVALRSPELGETMLRMDMDQQKAMLDIFVTRAEAQEVVQHSLAELEQIFTDKGIVLEGINVEVNPDLQFSQGTFSQGAGEGFSGAGEEGARPAGEIAALDRGDIYYPQDLFLDAERVNCFA